MVKKTILEHWHVLHKYTNSLNTKPNTKVIVQLIVNDRKNKIKSIYERL